MYSKVPSGDQMCGARVQSSSLNSSEGNSLNVNVLFPFLKDYYNLLLNSGLTADDILILG